MGALGYYSHARPASDTASAMRRGNAGSYENMLSRSTAEPTVLPAEQCAQPREESPRVVFQLVRLGLGLLAYFGLAFRDRLAIFARCPLLLKKHAPRGVFVFRVACR